MGASLTVACLRWLGLDVKVVVQLRRQPAVTQLHTRVKHFHALQQVQRWGLSPWRLALDRPLQVALKCILSALSECHKLGWTLNDLRWANVVVLQVRGPSGSLAVGCSRSLLIGSFAGLANGQKSKKHIRTNAHGGAPLHIAFPNSTAE